MTASHDIVTFLQSMGEQDMAQEVATMANRLDAFATGLDLDCAEAEQRAFEEVTHQRDSLRAELDALRQTNELLGTELFAFQEATGCDTADALRGQEPYCVIHEWDTVLGLVRKAGGCYTYDGRAADRVVPVFLAPQPAIPDGWVATHLKTGNEYRVIGEAINATNAQDGQTMVIYERDGVKYVREAGEFMEKFAAKGVAQ